MTRRLPLLWFTLAITLVILSSNVLVQYPLNDWLTWGAITYPFLITDLANRYFGDMPWITLGLGDLAVKVALALVTLMPFRAALALFRPAA